MSTLTFRDFTFCAQHHLANKFGAAASPHWHTYKVRFFFINAPDQDQLSKQLAHRYAGLHGSSLNSTIPNESSDEGLAAWFINDVQTVAKCVRVIVENDFQRGAEVFL